MSDFETFNKIWGQESIKYIPYNFAWEYYIKEYSIPKYSDINLKIGELAKSERPGRKFIFIGTPLGVICAYELNSLEGYKCETIFYEPNDFILLKLILGEYKLDKEKIMLLTGYYFYQGYIFKGKENLGHKLQRIIKEIKLL